MITPKSIEEVKKIKPPFFVKQADEFMANVFYSEQEFGYNKEGQAYVMPAISWRPYLTVGSEGSIMGNTPFRNRHISVVKDPDWTFVARPREMEAERLIVYTEQEVFRQAIKSIFEGAIATGKKQA